MLPNYSYDNIPPQHEPSVSFKYPDEITPEMDKIIEERAKEIADKRCGEFVKRFLGVVIKKRKPASFIASLSYIHGVHLNDILDVENATIENISNALGISRQAFHRRLIKTRTEFSASFCY